MKSFKDRLAYGFSLLNIEADDSQFNKFELFAELLLKWNRVYNLTAIKSEEEVLTKHLLDSATLVPFVRQFSEGKKTRVLDVGCGGGLPGIPLAILLSNIYFDLIDTVSKKISFVRQAAINLKLSNLNAINNRVENFYPEYSYDLISCRAFSSLSDFVSLTDHLLSEEGRWLAMKGKVPEDEIASLPEGIMVSEIIKLKVPYLEMERNLIVLSKKA